MVGNDKAASSGAKLDISTLYSGQSVAIDPSRSLFEQTVRGGDGASTLDRFAETVLPEVTSATKDERHVHTLERGMSLSPVVQGMCEDCACPRADDTSLVSAADEGLPAAFGVVDDKQTQVSVVLVNNCSN